MDRKERVERKEQGWRGRSRGGEEGAGVDETRKKNMGGWVEEIRMLMGRMLMGRMLMGRRLMGGAEPY